MEGRGNGLCLQVKGFDTAMKKYSLPVMLILSGALLGGAMQKETY